jgi:hypothetical protein
VAFVPSKLPQVEHALIAEGGWGEAVEPHTLLRNYFGRLGKNPRFVEAP